MRQAAQSLHSANAQVGVSVAEFFPKIGLTTFFGKVSGELSAFKDARLLLSFFYPPFPRTTPRTSAGRLRPRFEQIGVRGKLPKQRQRHIQEEVPRSLLRHMLS